MSNDLKIYYKAALENWTMPILKYKKKFETVKKNRKKAMIEPLLKEVTTNEKEMQQDPTLDTDDESDFTTTGHHNASIIKIADILQEGTKISVVQGSGGIGKTSLVDYVTYQWSQNEIFSKEGELKFAFLFRFFCRSLNRYRGRALTASDLFYEKFKVNISNIETVKGENILIILDGFDEFFAYQDIFNMGIKEDSITTIVRSMLTQETVLFPGHYTILTCRHHASDLLRRREQDTGKARWVEMLGFSQQAVEVYVDQFSEGNSSLAEYIKNRITVSLALKTLSKTPAFLCTICSLLSLEGSELIATNLVKMTDIYSWIVASFLKLHFASEERQFVDIPLKTLLRREKVREFLRGISKISYELLVANEIEFDCRKLSSLTMSDQAIHNLVAGFVLKNEDEFEARCEFSHVTMQEYFAAFHSITNGIDPSQLLKANWFQAVQFMAGFSSTRHRKSKEIKQVLLGDSVFVKNNSIAMILSMLPNDAVFYPQSYSKGFKRILLQIFFEAFDEADGLPYSYTLVYYNLPMKSEYWVADTLEDTALFVHFGKLLFASEMQYRLQPLRLIVKNTKLNPATFVGLFNVSRWCFMLYLDSVQMDIPVTDEAISNLFAAFEEGHYSLQELTLSQCHMSQNVERLLFKIIPLIFDVVLHKQHISLQDEYIVQINKENVYHVSPTKRLAFLSVIACTIAKGSGRAFGKYISLVKRVEIHYVQKGFDELKEMMQSMHGVLLDQDIGISEKIQNLTLKAVEEGKVYDDLIALAKSIPYLPWVEVDAPILTNGFVSELVHSFFASLENSHDETKLQRLKISLSFSNKNKRRFIMEKLAKIIPFIFYVDLRHYHFSLYDYEVLCDSISQAAHAQNRPNYGFTLGVLKLGNVFDGIYIKINTLRYSLMNLMPLSEAVRENLSNMMVWRKVILNHLRSIQEADHPRCIYAGNGRRKNLEAQESIVRIISQTHKEMYHIFQKTCIVYRATFKFFTKTNSLLISDHRRKVSKGQIQLLVKDLNTIDSLQATLLSTITMFSKSFNGVRREIDSQFEKIKRMRDKLKFAMFPNVKRICTPQTSLMIYIKFLDEKQFQSKQNVFVCGKSETSFKGSLHHLAMFIRNKRNLAMHYKKLESKYRMLRTFELRMKSMALTYVAKIASFVGIVHMSDNEISTPSLCKGLFAKIRDVQMSKEYAKTFALKKLFLGENFKVCAEAVEILGGHVTVFNESPYKYLYS